MLSKRKKSYFQSSFRATQNSTTGFKDFVLDQLVELPDLRAKRMFGGFGLYHDNTFFGIISNDTLYFKTDEQTRGRYTEAGSGPFRPNPKQTLKNYYEVPADVLEDSERLLEYAEEAIRIATSH